MAVKSSLVLLLVTPKLLLAFLLAVSMYPQLQVKKYSQIHGLGQVRTQTLTLSDLCTTTQCSVHVIATDATFINRATAIAAIFENTQLDSGASGSTTTGISAAKMDVATLDSSNASLPLKIVGIQDDVENEDFCCCWHSYDCDA